MNKIIIATDSFKGSLSAPEACGIIAAQVEQVFPEAEIVQLPISDGGEGLIEAILATVDADEKWAESEDPLSRPRKARYIMLEDGSALIEMAEAGGLTLLEPEEFDPLRTSTYGVGLVVLSATKAGANPIYIGLGGSATVDGGTGAATAMGLCFLDEQGEMVITGEGLNRIQRFDPWGLHELSYTGKIVLLTDVNNPLCGPNGAAAVYGPQKGATEEQVKQLDQGLENLAERIEGETGMHLRDIPGIGAAGGFALPYVAFMGAEMRSGIDFVLDLLDFDQRLDGTDLVITGEGRTDAQSAMGKAISAVAKRSRAAGVRVATISGALGEGAEIMLELGVDDLVQAAPAGQTLEDSIANAAENLEKAAFDYLSRLKSKL